MTTPTDAQDLREETEQKLQLIYETISDILFTTNPDQPEWKGIIEAGFNIADTYKKTYPQISMAFYETICEACPHIEQAYEEQNDIFSRAFWSNTYLKHTGA